jgi:hypothetical protein
MTGIEAPSCRLAAILAADVAGDQRRLAEDAAAGTAPGRATVRRIDAA